MHDWPAKEKAFAASFSAAASRSASPATTTGVELPSSDLTRLPGARPADREPELAGARLGGGHGHHRAGKLARLAGGEGVGRERPRGLDARRRQRLPGLRADRARSLLVAAAELGRDADEDLRPPVGG